MSTNGAKRKSISAGDIVVDCEPWVWSFSWDMHKKVCAHCFKLSDRLQVCSQCKLYNYCDADCQKSNWKKEHKVECDMLKNLNGFFTQAEVKEKKTRRADLTADRSFGLWTLEIILLKIINKIQRNMKDDFPEFGGKQTAVEILQHLPYVAEKEQTIKPHPGLFRTLHDFNAACLGIPADKLVISVKDMLDYYRIAHYNACRINNFNTGMSLPFGAGIFPTANHRELCMVCSDSNVTILFHGRRLRIHAIADIPSFNGMKDCRWYGLMRRPLGRTLKQRRDLYQKEVGRTCTCRKCTDEYDAEINPLKCATSGCTERVPSDNRALDACPQCGAINTDNLEKFRKLVAKQEKVLTEKLGKAEDFQDIIPVKIHLLKTLDEAGLVHPEAHLRYIYGWDAADRYLHQRDFESAWNLYDVLVPCVRRVFPKYHLQRAQHLQVAGIQCHVWFTGMSMCAHPNDRAKFLAIFADILPKAVDWLKESLDIYTKLYGHEGKMVEAVRENLSKTEQALRLLKSELAVREQDPERFSAVSEVVYKNIDFQGETPAHLKGAPCFNERRPTPSDTTTIQNIFQGLIPNTSVDWNEMAGLVVSEDSVTTVRYLSTPDGYYTVRGKGGDRGIYWNEEPDDWDARPFSFSTMVVLDREKKCVRDLMGVLEEKFGWANEVNENRVKFADVFEGKLGKIGWMMCELVNTNPVISSTLYDELKENIDKAVAESKPFAVDRHLLIIKAHLPVGGTMKDVQYANALEELWYKNAQATFCFEAGSPRNYLNRKMQGKMLVPVRIVLLLDAGRMYKMIKDLTTSVSEPPVG